MEKRYQVFVSSTFADLKEERQEVMQALLELDCIPAGMELFPAASEDQWTLIKKVIDDCDYYMVILAGRYGSIGPEGRSYTEMEYRYAIECGKPVLGFLHRSPGTLRADLCEQLDEGKKKLDAFRGLVQTKMCRFWEGPADLGSQVSRSMVKLMKNTPAGGWVKANNLPSENASAEILMLRKRIDELEHQIQSFELSGPVGSENLAQGNDDFELAYFFRAFKEDSDYRGTRYQATTTLTWDEIFAALAPLMMDEASEDRLQSSLGDLIGQKVSSQLSAEKRFAQMRLSNLSVSQDDFQTVKVQLRALGLILRSERTRSLKDTATYWTLTRYGDSVMTRLRARKKG